MKLTTAFIFSMPLISLLSLTSSVAGAIQAPYPKGPGHGTYEVPTTDSDLKPFAIYPIDHIDVHEVDEVTHITYALPLNLTGVKNVVDLTSQGTSDDGTYTRFTGPDAVANCTNDECRVRYTNPKIDLQAVENRLTAAGVSGDELTKRLNVTKMFSGDPVGIIRFTK